MIKYTPTVFLCVGLRCNLVFILLNYRHKLWHHYAHVNYNT